MSEPKEGELIRLRSTPRTQDGSVGGVVRVVEVAERQWGVVTRRQLELCGVGKAALTRWTDSRRAQRLYPGVYALGHRALRVEGRLAAVLLYAGPQAVLSHETAAWWWGLLDEAPERIHVSGGRHASIRGVAVHRPRRKYRTVHKRLPVTTVPRTLLDIAAVVPFQRLRRALAEAEYRRLVGLDEVERVLGRGRPGSAALRRALTAHRPQLARTRSALEERFLQLCERHSVPAPDVNVPIEGFTVDALWRAPRLVVELDGLASHATPAGMEEDRRRDLTLRRAGYTVLRYTWRQIADLPEAVALDLLRHL